MNNDEIMKSPEIILFDCSEEVHNALVKSHYNATCASLGKYYAAKNVKKDIFVNFQCNVPDNLHEYDICIIDMDKTNRKIDIECSMQPNEYGVQLILKYPDKNIDTSFMGANAIQNQFSDNCVF